MSYRSLIFLYFTICISYADSITIDSLKSSERSISHGKIILFESLASITSGTILGVGGKTIGSIFDDSPMTPKGELIGLSVGYISGTTIGVSTVGWIANDKGSFLLSLLGSTGGFFLGVLIGNLVYEQNTKIGVGIGIVSVYALSTSGSVIGFNIGRRINRNRIYIF